MPAAIILYILKKCIGNDRFIKTVIFTSEESILDGIEPRGEEIKDGFRTK